MPPCLRVAAPTARLLDPHTSTSLRRYTYIKPPGILTSIAACAIRLQFQSSMPLRSHVCSTPTNGEELYTSTGPHSQLDTSMSPHAGLQRASPAQTLTSA